MSKFIHCCCPRCKDPTELGTYLSSIKCKACPDGYVSLFKSKWICEKCLIDTTELKVQKLLSEVAEQIIYANGDIRLYEALLDKYSFSFHPNHFLMIDLKQNIASILKCILGNPMYRPGKGVLERKVKLCEELLPIVRAVQPGISKMYAIALYEFAVSFFELTDFEFNENEIMVEEYKKRLIKVQGMLRESIQMLIFEPKNSHEGRLVQRIEEKFKQIEGYLL